MRNVLVVLWMLVCSIAPASAQVSIGIGLPGVSIGINVPVYPELVRVPGYPVYYAPRMSSNYFFYDGLYWVYQRDNWYASSWYNGPWGIVAPEYVPLYILRVPVRYYRQPPVYFHGWRSDAPPQWGSHWGNSWEQNHRGWDNWNRSSVPAPAPLPSYQRQYSGTRYPQAEQQPVIQSRNYRYQPQDAVVQQHYQAQRVQSAPASPPPQDQRGGTRQPPPQQGAAPPQHGQPPQTGGTTVQRPVPVQPPQQAAPREQRPPQQQPQGAAPREQRPPQQQPQGAAPREQRPPQQQPQGAPTREQRPPQQQPQAAPPHDQKAPKAQGQDKGQPPKDGPAQEPKQKERPQKGEQQGS